MGGVSLLFTGGTRGTELTDGDTLLVPFHGKDAAALRVEGLAIGDATPVRNPAARIVINQSIAVCLAYGSPCEIVLTILSDGQYTSGFGVPGHLVVLVIVHSFQNIYLSSLRPSDICAYCPECWPYTAPPRSAV